MITAIILRPIYEFNLPHYFGKREKTSEANAKARLICVILIRFSLEISLAAPFLKPINPYIKHWEAAHFDAKIIAAARYQHEINRRRKRYANNTVHSHGTPPLNTIKFQFNAHNR